MSDYKNNLKKSDPNFNISPYKKKKYSIKTVMNNEHNIFRITNYISKLRKNYSQDYIDFNKIKKRNELNISGVLTTNHDYNIRTIFLDNKKAFNSICQNKKYMNLKKPLYTNINNKFNNSNKSTNYLDSKSFDETKSKLDNKCYTNINSSINIDPNINSNQDNAKCQIQIQNENHDEIQNENQKQNPIKISLPLLFKPKKKYFKRKHISYLIKSKNKKISAKDIYLHYIKENEIDNSNNKIYYNSTKDEFVKYLKDIENKKFNYSLEKIYGNDKNYVKRINELKKNTNIAFKKDFNIEDYQWTLMKLLKKRISDKSMENLGKSYKVFNERNFGTMVPKGRYINLADKLKDFLSKEIFEKVKRLDRNYKIFLEKNEQANQRNLIDYKNKKDLYKSINNAIISLSRKEKEKEKKEFYL